MNRNEQRIRRLEEALAPGIAWPVILWADEGESEADCIRRSGHDPADTQSLFVVINYV
jgi:hypothetical protein